MDDRASRATDMTYRRTRAEMETIVRWDQDERIAELWTAHPAQARRWRKTGVSRPARDWRLGVTSADPSRDFPSADQPGTPQAPARAVRDKTATATAVSGRQQEEHTG